MKQTIFRGMATALVTPMREGNVDFEAYGRLIDWQIAQGIHALVAVGTTGESATLTDAERLEVIRFTVERVGGRVPVIAGTGSNCTAHAVQNTKDACKEGIDAVLAVTPYYNKASQSGLIAHFSAIADASTVPVVLYNVPTRTGCNLLPDTVAVLAEHPRIAAIKEASGNMSQAVELFAKCGGKLDIYSGEDALTVPFLSMGGSGTISVLSNVVPKLASEMAEKALAGDFAAAAELQCRLLPLVNALFSQVNPIPAKAALAAMGFGEDSLRLPLTPMEEPYRSRMLQEMRKLGVEV
ncbi:MAG: 4-hydroxy-tetrahydrodipicolinate synthase [Faecousia sp.]